MAQAVIVIDLDNASFDDDFEGEISSILSQAESLIIVMEEGNLRDYNGNAVGTVSIEDDDDEDEDDEDEE